MKRCSTPLISREMQIRTTMRCHLILISMTIIKKSTNNKCWRESREMGTLLHCWWPCELVQPLWKTVWWFLRKLKIELLSDSAVPPLSIHLDKTIIQKDTCTLTFTTALLTIAKTCPAVDDWIKKIHIYSGTVLIKKKEIMPFVATRTQLEMIILGETSQKEKDKYHVMSLTCGI